MKKTLLAIAILFCFFAFGQNQYENYRFYEGGSEKATIDLETDVNTLIQGLEKEWEFEFTGKGYWIGYTDLMYSIAARKDKAIQPLLDFYRKTNSTNGKIGVLYTLHLIGIESTIAGRFYEEFKNENARKALLHLLKTDKEEYKSSIMQLLMRDPWKSDVPILMQVMKTSTDDCWAIVNALMRYDLKDKPFHQDLPKSISSKFLTVEEDSIMKIGNNFMYADVDSVPDTYYHKFLRKLKKEFKNTVEIEAALFKILLRGESGYSNSIGHLLYGNIINGMVNNDLFAYISLGEKIQYYIEDNVVYFCTPSTAKKRWLDWWETNKSNWSRR